jgi:hypothetical protein
MPYKTGIFKVTDIEPIQKAAEAPLQAGDIVQQKNMEWKVGEPRFLGPPMRVVQVAGTHVLTNFQTE